MFNIHARSNNFLCSKTAAKHVLVRSPQKGNHSVSRGLCSLLNSILQEMLTHYIYFCAAGGVGVLVESRVIYFFKIFCTGAQRTTFLLCDALAILHLVVVHRIDTCYFNRKIPIVPCRFCLDFSHHLLMLCS